MLQLIMVTELIKCGEKYLKQMLFYIELSQRLCYPTHLNVTTRQSLSLSKTQIQGSKGKDARNMEDGQKNSSFKSFSGIWILVIKEVKFEKHFTKSC